MCAWVVRGALHAWPCGFLSGDCGIWPLALALLALTAPTTKTHIDGPPDSPVSEPPPSTPPSPPKAPASRGAGGDMDFIHAERADATHRRQ